MKMEKDLEMIFGFNVIEEVIDSREENVKTLFVLESKSNSRIKALVNKAKSKEIIVSFKSKRFFKENFENLNHQGVSILCKKRKEENETFLDGLLGKKVLLLLVLDHLTDPHNVGACLRSASAANVDAVIVPKNRACHLSPSVRKISSGGSELIPFIIVTNLVRTLEKIRSCGVEVVGADPLARDSYSDIDLGKKVAFVIGAEDRGLKRLTSKNCDRLVKIDMPGRMESLNTSVSASILIFEYLRKNKNTFLTETS